MEPVLESISIEPIRRTEPEELIESGPGEADVVLTHRDIPHPVHRKPTDPNPQPQVEEKKRSKFQFNVLSFKICPVCEATVPANSRRCGRCATRLDNICPHCGMAVPEGVSFCGRCGNTLA